MTSKTYHPKQKQEISYFVNARQKTYLNSTEIYIPNDPYEKLEEGFELSKDRILSGALLPTSEEDKLERSKRRTYIAVKDIALSNVFELFATFTFKEKRYDDEETRRKMVGWLKRQRKQDKAFQYLIVSELHKRCEECVNTKEMECLHDDRPKALHFHALIAGYRVNLIRAINPYTGKPLVKKNRKVYDFPNFTLGNSEIYLIGDSEEDRIKSSFYLLKYLKKDMPTFKSKKRYWSSRGLNKPYVKENPEEWYLAVTPDHYFETPHGRYFFFDNKRIEIFLP
jgi:hypothetical protein